jgi:hypothetical protein
MNKLLLLIFAITCYHLEATHFQSSVQITPTSKNNEFLVETRIEKAIDNHTTELIASPKLICVQGKPAQLKIESKDRSDLLLIQVMIPENSSPNGIRTSIFMKEKGQIVLSSIHILKTSQLYEVH